MKIASIEEVDENQLEFDPYEEETKEITTAKKPVIPALRLNLNAIQSP